MTRARTRSRWALATALVAGVVVLVLGGCANAAPVSEGTTAAVALAAATARSAVVVDGVTRAFTVRAPDGADTGDERAVLVMAHGAGGDGARAEAVTGFTALAEQHGFIVVYPDGTQAADVPGELAWNGGACCGTPAARGTDDVAFLDAMLDALDDEFSVDESRIYLAGYSNGGMLTYGFACEHGDRLAGIAVVGGAFNVAECASPRPLPVLIVHGTADATVPYRGGETNERTAARFGQWMNASVDDAARFWSGFDGCDATTVTVTTTGAISRAATRGCDNSSRVDVVSIEGGTHAWPTGANGLDASSLIVDFFGLGAAPTSFAR